MLFLSPQNSAGTKLWSVLHGLAIAWQLGERKTQLCRTLAADGPDPACWDAPTIYSEAFPGTLLPSGSHHTCFLGRCFALAQKIARLLRRLSAWPSMVSFSLPSLSERMDLTQLGFLSRDQTGLSPHFLAKKCPCWVISLAMF